MTTPPSTRQEVTQLLGDWSGGDEQALEKLFPLVEPELHRLAHHYMSRERAGHTLQTTAILNEAYLRLVGRRDRGIPETLSTDGGARMDHGQGLALPGAERGRSLMKAERWKQVNDLFQSAVERAPGERAAFLDETCHSDEELRREVESLLTSHEQATNFIELPAFEVAPELVTNDIAGAVVGKDIGHYRIDTLIGVG